MNRHEAGSCRHLGADTPRSARPDEGPRRRRACAGRRAALLGDAPRRRDLLIEFLHRIQDRYGCISAAHIVALAQELKLAMTEVYEVATFYHHFDVVKERDAPPPQFTVRVCETLSCQMAGADELRAALERAGGRDVRVLGRRASDAASMRPSRSSDAIRSTVRRWTTFSPTIAKNAVEAEVPPVHRLRRLSQAGRISDIAGMREAASARSRT